MRIYLINSIIIALAVGIHYEVLSQLSRRIPALNIASRFKVIVGVFGALCAHVAGWTASFLFLEMTRYWKESCSKSDS